MKNLFKKSNKKSSISNFNAEKLSEKESKQVMGGAINYNASKSNTGSVTATGSGLPADPNATSSLSGGSGN